jgi:hypothetical protein
VLLIAKPALIVSLLPRRLGSEQLHVLHVLHVLP